VAIKKWLHCSGVAVKWVNVWWWNCNYFWFLPKS
jgi:hypothetical protein